MQHPFGRFQPRVLLAGAVALVVAGPIAPRHQTPSHPADELLAADRAFSAASASSDVVTGLSRMFAADVVMPTPNGSFARGARAAKEALEKNPDNARSRLEWTPVRVGVSADGLHGFSWGYMTLTKPDGATTPLKYLAYWIRGDSGWRVAVYKRALRPAGSVSLEPVPPALPPRLVAPSKDEAAKARFRDELGDTERAFSQEAQKIGLGVAFQKYGAPDAVNMGGPNNATFVVGPEAIGKAVSEGQPAGGSTVTWEPHQVVVATSGDLGVTIGMITPKSVAADRDDGAPQSFPFFTIWRRQHPGEPWRFVAE